MLLKKLHRRRRRRRRHPLHPLLQSSRKVEECLQTEWLFTMEF